MNKASIVILSVLTILITSCQSQPLLPPFRIGMAEKVWKNAIDSLKKTRNIKEIPGQRVNDYFFNWKIEDTSIKVKVQFNDDGVNSGNLRKITVDISSDNGIETSIADSVVSLTDSSVTTTNTITDKNLNQHQESGATYDATVSKVASVASVTKLVTHLAKIFGHADSLSINGKKIYALSDLNNADYFKSSCTFYFSRGKEVVQLDHDSMVAPSYRIPFYHYYYTFIFCESKNLIKEAENEAVKKYMHLSPTDYIFLPVDYRLNYDTKTVAISVTLNPLHRKNAIDPRSITGIRGHIDIRNAFKETIQTFPDLKIAADPAIEQPYKPGSMGYDSKYINYIGQNISWSIGFFSCTPEFRKYYMSGENGSAEFIPEVIYLDDGSVIK